MCSSRASTGPWPGGRTTTVTESPRPCSARSTISMGPDHALAKAEIQTRELPPRNASTAPPLLRARDLAVRSQRSQVHRRVSRAGHPLPLPRQQHTGPVGTPAGPGNQLTPAGKTRGAPGAVRVARRVRRAGRGNPPGAILAGRPGPTQLAAAAPVRRRARTPDPALSHWHARPPAAVNAGHFSPDADGRPKTGCRRPASHPVTPSARPGMTHREEQSMRRRIKSTHNADMGSPFNRSSAGQRRAGRNRMNRHSGAVASNNAGFLPRVAPLRWRARLFAPVSACSWQRG